MEDFVVDPVSGAGARAAKLVDGDPGKELGGGPGVGVGPNVEFFGDPGEEGHGGVVQGQGESVGFGRLEEVIAYKGEEKKGRSAVLVLGGGKTG